MIQIIFLLSISTIFHFGLKIFNVESEFVDTFVMYTVIIRSFSPIVVLLNYPGTIKAITAINESKFEDGASSTEFIFNLYTSMSSVSRTGIIDKLLFFIVPFAQTFSMLLMVILLRELVKRYRCKKVRAYSAIAFCSTVLLIPAYILFSLFNFYTLYIFIHDV